MSSSEQAPEIVDDSSSAEVNEDGDYTQQAEVPEAAGGESIKGNQISEQELSDISKDNIIEGDRSTRGDPLAADKEIDQQVDAAVEADEGQA